jgi:hypothetical protein
LRFSRRWRWRCWTYCHQFQPRNEDSMFHRMHLQACMALLPRRPTATSRMKITYCVVVYDIPEFNRWSSVAQTAALLMKPVKLFCFKPGGDRRSYDMHRNRASSFRCSNPRFSIPVQTWTALRTAWIRYCSAGVM